MKKWEYKKIGQKSYINISDLNELGIEGWELVNTIPANIGNHILLFKREIEKVDNNEWNYCSDIKPSGYDDALPKYFQVAVKFTIAGGKQTVTDVIRACYFQENDKWYIHENDPEPLYGEVYAWRELPKIPPIKE